MAAWVGARCGPPFRGVSQTVFLGAAGMYVQVWDVLGDVCLRGAGPLHPLLG